MSPLAVFLLPFAVLLPFAGEEKISFSFDRPRDGLMGRTVVVVLRGPVQSALLQ